MSSSESAEVTALRETVCAHHEVMNLGHHAADWKVFRQLTGVGFVRA
jgi:hypothetical protein